MVLDSTRDQLRDLAGEKRPGGQVFGKAQQGHTWGDLQLFVKEGAFTAVTFGEMHR